MKPRARPGLRALLIGMLAAHGATAHAEGLPSFEQVKARYQSSDTLLLDRHGTPLHAIRTNKQVLRGEWTPLSQMSPALRNAMLLSEDRRFYQHSGVDWQAVSAAAWGNLFNSRTRGASTLTMQLAGLLDEQWALPDKGQRSRSVVGKLGQAAMAWRLEHNWRKDQILEAYLNLVGFRGELAGISALSSSLFGKYPSGLNAEEASIAAALVRAPNAAPERVASRACEVLREQRPQVPRTQVCLTLPAYTRQVLATRHRERLEADDQLAPHLAARILRDASSGIASPLPAHLTTTLDARLQRLARDTLRERLQALKDRNVHDGAVIVLDNATGEVRAWVGSSGAGLSQAAEVDGVSALRQAGSTLKPFLYAMALEQQWLTAASILDDSPVDLRTAGGLYIPQNYDHDFKGPVSLRTALAASLNVPAVRTLVMVTPERFGQGLIKLGLPLTHSGDYYGYSLALGSAEVTLATLANAYRVLANGGVYAPVRWLPNSSDAANATNKASPSKLGPHATRGIQARMSTSGTSTTHVIHPEAAYIVANVLADREARVPTFGLDNALATRYWSAVKTGTSKDMRDNWCVGFSRRYTVAVWVGNADGEPMWDVSGVTGAAPVWRAVMDELHRGLAPAALQARPPPAGLVHQAVRFERGLEPPRDEWFIAGTEQSDIQLASAMGQARALIQSPTHGSIIALDPDIPPQAQQLSFRAMAGTPVNWAWQLDGKRLGIAKPTTWRLWPGKHTLALLDQRGLVQETAEFEVRGAQAKPGLGTKDIKGTKAGRS